MKWRCDLWRIVSGLFFNSPSRWARLTLPGWDEDSHAKNPRVWRDSVGDLISLDTLKGDLDLPQGSEEEMRGWCRELARDCGAGLIEAYRIGHSSHLIYKRLQMGGYVYTGMYITTVQDCTLVWTVVAGEHGITGVREAIVTENLMNAGKLTLDGFKRSFAQDPYEPDYHHVDRSVLRFMSDDELYDGQFPHHPLSNVRRVLAALPSEIKFDPPKAGMNS